MTRYSLEPADDVFLLTAPERFVHKVDLPLPPARVWDLLTGDDALSSWSRVITAATWTTPRPFGVGTIREVVLGGAVRVEERFYRWIENERMTFSVDAASIPGLHRFAEDLVLHPTAHGTLLQWTIAIEGNAPLRPLLRLARPLTATVTASVVHGIRTRTTSEDNLHGRTAR
ncbi:SRPBCC family protein [Aldersonia kunmingensis]|uniref:SRPBCC family protein n=1 Tax=Aldersonia kunmingensis TaxID=408066 RepID=UPI000829781B|nr:SRPBCC family protein [Aldersonia kunmingensis]